MSSSSFALLDTKYGDENKVVQPRAARATRGNHRFDHNIINNKIVGYVEVQYEHEEYPRMLYHPNWGMEKKPDMAKFAVGCVTSEQFQQAFLAFQEAENKWNRSNRTKLATDKKHEESLLKKGWLVKPPIRKENPAFDLGSDEI